MPNRLAGETSPYLLQHAENPVDWYPWGEEALDRARRENKPILLSIGYSACHWCHVMAHESFEKPETAQLMNEHFINIKVDREERPDLDSIYMEAVQVMTGSGGWPLTVFLTPEGKPYYGGTYFPPQDRYGMPVFPRVLTAVADAYRHRREDIETTVTQLEEALAGREQVNTSSEPLTGDILTHAYLLLKHNFDEIHGGLGSAPKFPQPTTFEFLLRYYLRSKDNKALQMVELTLDRMANGGVYDQIGGGFHRYSTDTHWLVPHFEKMLYDNALLSRLYLNAYRVTGTPFYCTVAENTLDYVLREMTGPEGGFYSTQDADSEGIEGKYYVWTPQEIMEVVGEKNSDLIKRHYDVTEGGNFEGQNILHVTEEIPPELLPVIEQSKQALLERREQRTTPGRDEKILASWNGLMLTSLAEAASALEREGYRAAAIASGEFLLNNMMIDGYLQHTCKDGKARIDGYLQDYAMVIEGLLALHEATFKGKWLKEALRLVRIMVEQFWDESIGKFYDTGTRHEELFIRPGNPFDEAVPSGASSATMVLLKLGALTDNEWYRQIAATSLRSMADLIGRQVPGFSNWLCALDFYLTETREIAIVGSPDHPDTVKLCRALYSQWMPNKVVAALDPEDGSRYSDLKLFERRTMINGRPTVYVCEGYTCKTPVTDADSLTQQLNTQSPH